MKLTEEDSFFIQYPILFPLSGFFYINIIINIIKWIGKMRSMEKESIHTVHTEYPIPFFFIKFRFFS